MRIRFYNRGNICLATKKNVTATVAVNAAVRAILTSIRTAVDADTATERKINFLF